ncbi:MAG: endonuclease/exonuclease/phosphatase family protein [Bacteroidia bacterium]|nr:endonuclease/exonuclease/phosphatase family protein [Bacteroidia bacterium]
MKRKINPGKLPQWITGILLLSASVLCLTSSDNFVSSMLQTFAVQLLAFTAVTSVAALMMKRQILATFCGLSALLLFVFLLPFLGMQFSVPQEGEAELRVAHFNVLEENDDHDLLICNAMDTQADLLSFQEVDDTWADSLNELLAMEYPYSRIIPRENHLGMALFSKYPLRDLHEKEYDGLPNLSGRVCLPAGCVGFVASNSPRSTTSDSIARRNAHLHQLENWLQEMKGPKIAIGDLQMAPLSAQMDTFQLQTRMLDSRQSLSARAGALTIPSEEFVDYIFHSEELNCLGFSHLDSTRSGQPGILGWYKWRRES